MRKLVTLLLRLATGRPTGINPFTVAAFWSAAGAVLTQGLNLAMSVCLARLLGTVGFGQLATVQSTIGMFGLFAGMALGITTTKYVAEFGGRAPARAGRIIALSLLAAAASSTLIAAGLAIGAPVLAGRVLNCASLAPVLSLSTLLLVTNAVNGVQTGALAGFGAFRSITGINVTRSLVSLAAAIVAVKLWGLPGAVWALIAGTAVSVWHAARKLREECRRNGIPIEYRNCLAERKVLWEFSLPSVLSGTMFTPITWAAHAILVNQPDGYRSMAVFSAANQWRTAVAFLPTALSQPLLSSLSGMVGNGDTAGFRRLLRGNMIFTAGTATLVGGLIVLAGPWIMRVYGPGYTAAPLALLMFSAVIEYTAAVMGQAIDSLRRMWYGFLLNAIWAVVLLGATWLLVPSRGAVGLAGAYAVSYLVHGVTTAAYGKWAVWKAATRSGQAAPAAETPCTA